MTLTDLLQYTERMDKAIYATKELLGESLPYVVENTIDGTTKGKRIIFNEHFINTVIEALSTGCIAKMNTEEEDVFFNYLDYANAQGQPDNIADTKDKDVSIALNNWLTNILYCRPNPVMNACFDSKFEYTTC